MKLVGIAGIAFALALVGCEEKGDLVLAECGKPSAYQIVVPANPSGAVPYAAEELRDWTEKLTGVRLAIVTNAAPKKAIYLGGLTETGLGSDGFRLRTEGRSLRIVASDERGVLYGVYELLETYGGIGWFASEHAVIPNAGRLAVPEALDVREVPAFPFREPFDYDSNRHPEFAVRLRQNCMTWGSPIPSRMGGLARQPPKVLRGHTADILCPVETHFDAHPEWFSEIAGKRIHRKTQLCLTNPELIEFVKSNFVAQVKADPKATYYSFANNDWFNCCTCPNCKAVNDAEDSQAGTTLRMGNILAEELEKIAPGKVVLLDAYLYSRTPPKLTKPRDNVLVDFAPIECERSVPMNESADEATRKCCEDFSGWGRIASKAGLQVFDYVTNFGNYYNIFPNVFSLQGNIRYFRDNRVKVLFEEGAHTTPHAAFAELKTWLLAKLMWNPDLDVNAAINRFLQGYYGPSAAPIVRRYLDAIHALRRDPAKQRLHLYEGFGSSAYSEEFLGQMLGLWQEAEKAAAADGPAYVKHAQWGAMSPVSMILQREAAEISVKRTEYPDARIRELAKWMIARMDEIGPDFLIAEGESRRTKKLRARWQRLADPTLTMPPRDSAVVETEDVFYAWASFRAACKEDPKASGGKAFAIPNAYSGAWILYMPMGSLAFDADTTYALRVRARVDRAAGAPEGEMFEAGVSDGGLQRKFRTSPDSDEYRWYDIGTWKPAFGQEIYLAPGCFDKEKFGMNPAFETLWMDQVEIRRVP